MVNKSLNLGIKIEQKNSKKFSIEVDSEKLERIMAGLGLFSSDFEESLDRAEKDYENGDVEQIKNFKDLR